MYSICTSWLGRMHPWPQFPRGPLTRKKLGKPGEAMEAALTKAAQAERRGPKAKAGLLVRDDLRLEYDGPADPAALAGDPRFRLRCAVRIGTSRVMRTRPRFEEWAADLVVEYLPSMLNPHDIGNFVAVAGEQIGVGDWRPRCGRFRLDGSGAVGAPGGR